MIPNKKEKPDYIINVGGREFQLYWYTDESSGELLLDLPNFLEDPIYTNEGRPFTLAVQESCNYGKDDDDPNDSDPGDCGGCGWFHREVPLAPIGICMCDAMKNKILLTT